MQATGTPLAGYLPLFRARQADLLARGEAAGHPADVAATLGLALSRLAGEAPAAAGLARLLAFLAPEPVPLALLLASERPRIGWDRRRQPRLGHCWAIRPGDAITALRRYSLVSPAGNGLVLVHRLVQAITRTRLTAEAAGPWEQAAAALVEAAVPADAQLPAAWPVCAVLMPHARAVLDLTSHGMWQIAQYLAYSGSYLAARDLLQLITDAYRDSDAHGPEHPDTLGARHELAAWTGVAGDAAGARDRLAALLPVEERILGAEHPTPWPPASFSPLDRACRRSDRGPDRYAALLPVIERVLGPEHPAPSPPARTWPAGPERRGMRPRPATSSPRCCPSRSGSSAPSTRAPWPTAATWPAGPGRRGMRTGPATSSPRCCRSSSGSWAPSTRAP